MDQPIKNNDLKNVLKSQEKIHNQLTKQIVYIKRIFSQGLREAKPQDKGMSRLQYFLYNCGKSWESEDLKEEAN